MKNARNQQLKALLIILVFSIISGTAFGQKKDDDKKGKPGLLLGANISNLSTGGADNKTGFYGGVLWEQKIIPLIRLQSGLTYVQNGLKTESAGVETKLNLNYLQIPVIAKVKVAMFYGLAGFTGGYRVAATTVVNDQKIKVDKESLNRLDLGAQVGVGFKILFFGIEGRYNWGLSNVYSAENADAKNRYFQLGIHFML
jgi:hypothetical protein